MKLANKEQIRENCYAMLGALGLCATCVLWVWGIMAMAEAGWQMGWILAVALGIPFLLAMAIFTLFNEY